jgi:hypothetical protein
MSEFLGYFARTGLIESYGKDLGFESGNISSGWEWGRPRYDNNPATPDRLRTVTNPRIEGSQALEVTVLPDDLVDNGARAEVSHIDSSLPDFGYFVNGDNTWFHWYTFFPSNLQVPQETWHIWTQWHQRANISRCLEPSQGGIVNCGTVPITFNLRNYVNGGEMLELLVIDKDVTNPNNFKILWESLTATRQAKTSICLLCCLVIIIILAVVSVLLLELFVAPALVLPQ